MEIRSKQSLIGTIDASSKLVGRIDAGTSSKLVGCINIGTSSKIVGRVNVGGVIEKEIPVFEGPYIIRPSSSSSILPTKETMMEKDLTIEQIPYAEVSNLSGGITITIGG